MLWIGLREPSSPPDGTGAHCGSNTFGKNYDIALGLTAAERSVIAVDRSTTLSHIHAVFHNILALLTMTSYDAWVWRKSSFPLSNRAGPRGASAHAELLLLVLAYRDSDEPPG